MTEPLLLSARAFTAVPRWRLQAGLPFFEGRSPARSPSGFGGRVAPAYSQSLHMFTCGVVDIEGRLEFHWPEPADRLIGLALPRTFGANTNPIFLMTCPPGPASDVFMNFSVFFHVCEELQIQGEYVKPSIRCLLW